MDERRLIERWAAWVRLGAFAFAFFQVVVLRDDYPNGATSLRLGARPQAWRRRGVFLWLSRRELSSRALAVVGFTALVFDTAVVSAFVLIYSFELGTPVARHW